MAGHEGDILAQGPELAGDGGDQLGIAAAGEVGAAYGALEQDVPDLGEAGLAMEEDHMARGVAGAVIDLELGLAQGDAVAVVQPAVLNEVASVNSKRLEQIRNKQRCLDGYGWGCR